MAPGPAGTGEITYRRKDGTLLPVRVTSNPLIDRDGRYAGALVMVSDLTERKQAEAVRERLAAIVDSSEDAIIGMTPEGIIETWNAAATHLYGYTPEHVVGRGVSLLAPPNRADETLRMLDLQRQGGGATRYETVRVHSDGHAIDVAVTLSPLRDGAGALVGAATITRDITTLKQAFHRLSKGEGRQ